MFDVEDIYKSPPVTLAGHDDSHAPKSRRFVRAALLRKPGCGKPGALVLVAVADYSSVGRYSLPHLIVRKLAWSAFGVDIMWECHSVFKVM